MQSYRIAVGPQAVRQAFTLHTVPTREEDKHSRHLAKANSFPLHADVAAKAHQRRKLERLCRYIARPAVATDRLSDIGHYRPSARKEQPDFKPCDLDIPRIEWADGGTRRPALVRVDIRTLRNIKLSPWMTYLHRGNPITWSSSRACVEPPVLRPGSDSDRVR